MSSELLYYFENISFSVHENECAKHGGIRHDVNDNVHGDWVGKMLLVKNT